MSIDPEGNTSIMDYDELITPVQLASSQPIPAATPIPGDLLATSMTDPNNFPAEGSPATAGYS